jgi:hypothetical protein
MLFIARKKALDSAFGKLTGRAENMGFGVMFR